LKKESKTIKKTPLHKSHLELGASMVEFAGWSMPLNYPDGISSEHLATRKNAGLFDISHMGRFIISGKNNLGFLQHVLTSNAGALEIGESQYTILSGEEGVAIDDAYLYRFNKGEYLLVVNAVNTEKDLKHLKRSSKDFKDISVKDVTDTLSMLSLQGPLSKEMLLSVISAGRLPEPLRNKSSIVKIGDSEVLVARTGYTGEPLGFELFADSKDIQKLWTLLVSRGPSPVGLGARDTLRLEAGLPLYGHELGMDTAGNGIPVFAPSQSRLAVSFSPVKGDFIGKDPLKVQFEALKRILDRDFSNIEDLPGIIMQLELLERGIARRGDRVLFKGKDIGYITSGTIVPYWKPKEKQGRWEITDDSGVRSLALAYLDPRRWEQDVVDVEIRGKMVKAVIMPYFLRSEAPPYSYPVISDNILKKK
jgi:aminomethyltransferase